jgi:hypothetical protein
MLTTIRVSFPEGQRPAESVPGWRPYWRRIRREFSVGVDDSARSGDTGDMALSDFIAMVRRGFFAGLIAMAVVASGSAHASIAGIEDGAAAEQAGQIFVGHAHHAASSKQAASHTEDGSHQPDGKADGTMCKVQCAFSMILPLPYDGVAAHGQNVWAFSPAIAVLPGEIVADLRPPRA